MPVHRLCALMALVFLGGSALGDDSKIDPLRFEKQVIVPACKDPIQLEVLSDGRILFIEREGMVRLSRVSATTNLQETVDVGKIPAAYYGEVGLVGLACDRNFDKNHWAYFSYCPEAKRDTMRLSRFTIVEDKLDLSSEKMLFDYPIEPDGAIHMGGGLCMDARGNLHMGTGDNSLPIAELPVDRRPGKTILDAMRSSANSMDLRGKVLRIHPNDDGTYSIPAGNLFTDAKQGRAEIYAMGCRNPFRVTVDDKDGTVYWGDVGPNIALDLGIGPNGYDEVNRAPRSGNFGWPMFVGPNEAYHDFDFQTRKPGRLFDINKPINDSPNNKGLQELPKPQGAFLWYPSAESNLWLHLGSGGRSAFAGPVYHADQYAKSELRMPDALDGQLFIYDWTRNWLRTVTIDEQGLAKEVHPFMPSTVFRKPIEMKFGPDGSMYIIEYGDKWSGNTDSQIARVIYRRGNRAPRAVARAIPAAGREPLNVELDATGTTDLDVGDSLKYAWKINGKPLAETSPKLKTSFGKPGYFAVELTVTDSTGAKSTTVADVRVGNAPPAVKLASPLHGSFFDWGQTIRYRIGVSDQEDGSTQERTVESGRVLLGRTFQTRNTTGVQDGDDSLLDPGLALMRKTTCFSCHTTKSASAGPPYREVGKKYAQDAQAGERLAAKIIAGGTGVWGTKPMPPHPQHTLAQTRLMVNWILSLASDGSAEPIPGSQGFFRPMAPPRPPGVTVDESGVLILTSEYTDNGRPEVPGVLPLRSEDVCLLHTRRKRAAFFDRYKGAEIVDVFERRAGLVARLGSGDWIAFDGIRLTGVDKVAWNAAALGTGNNQLALRLDSPDGPEIASITIKGESDQLGETFHDYLTPIQAPDDKPHNLYIVARYDDSTSAQDESTKTRRISLSSITFPESAESLARRQAEESKVKRIVLIPTKLDHAWATHMYSDVCKLLAACLNNTPGVEAIVSPNLDWPADERMLDEADAIVYYSRPAGDITLSAAHREKFESLLKRKVGFTAIHWATGAEVAVGDRFTEVLGGYFNFKFAGLKVDKRPLQQVKRDHPICRGWNGYDLRDEFYLNLKFSPTAQPVLNVNVDGIDQTVAWVQERADGGRSFGTTLGHFHDNYERSEFRKLLVNGILWTAGVETPESGADVEIGKQLLTLPELPKAIVKDYVLDDLLPLLNNPIRGRSFARGEKLFQQASCASCHRIGTIGGKLGPNLSDVRVRLAAKPNPTAALLHEIVDPSHEVQEKYRTHTLLLVNGETVSGIVVSERDGVIEIVSNPNKPDEARKIPATEIDERKVSPISMMPKGLLNTLNQDEILDLFAFVESGGQTDYVMFTMPTEKKLEPWANQKLPIQRGLQWWLDASRLNAGRMANGQSDLKDGQTVDVWFDASGNRHTADQRQDGSRPHLELRPQGQWVRFDGKNDYLVAEADGLKSREFTAFVLMRPYSNRGWPGVVSANAFYRNDFLTGMNIDLMNIETGRFETVMIEGPGYGGIINQMRDQIDYGQFVVLTVISQPGIDGVKLRINGRAQKAKDRPDTLMSFDQMCVGARFWSNEATPAYNRGFLDADVAQLLLYTKSLKVEEVEQTEKFLQEMMREISTAAVPPREENR